MTRRHGHIDDIMSTGGRPKRSYVNLNAKKATAAARILDSGLWAKAEAGKDMFDLILATWTSMVGEHRNDMGCGTVSHMCHTRDLPQLKATLERMAGRTE